MLKRIGVLVSNDGFDNETALVLALDGKTFGSLNPNLQKAVKVMFPSVQAGDLLGCQKKGGTDKADIEVSLGSERRKISIKKGSGNSVHQEPVENFIAYLREEFGDDEDVFNPLRHFIWGDESLDGSSHQSLRMDARAYAKRYEDNVELIKNYFRDKKDKLIHRFILQGAKGNNVPDFIYYGDIDNGYCVSSEKILEYMTDGSNESRSVIPIGPLTFQAWNRAIEVETKSEAKRGVIQLKFPSIREVMEQLANE